MILSSAIASGYAAKLPAVFALSSSGANLIEMVGGYVAECRKCVNILD